MFAFLTLKCLFGSFSLLGPGMWEGTAVCDVLNIAPSPLTLLDGLGLHYKSFYNKLHKPLWCLNIYGCLWFPEGCFLSETQLGTKSSGAAPDLLSLILSLEAWWSDSLSHTISRTGGTHTGKTK